MNPQQDLQRMKIDPDSSCLRFIHQIDADDQLFTPRHQLKCKRQAPSKARCVTDGDQSLSRLPLFLCWLAVKRVMKQCLSIKMLTTVQLQTQAKAPNVPPRTTMR